MMLAWDKKTLSACSMVALSVALQACGGGSSNDDTSAEVPSFAGTYKVTLTKTSDSCKSTAAKSFSVTQTVTQSERSITLVSNAVTMHGSVDTDNAGLSVSAQRTSNGISGTYSTVYRNTSTPGLYGAGFSLVLRSGSAVCSVSYNGEARRQ